MIIETMLKGQKNLDVLNTVIGQLSDGIWENSRVMEKYWKNLKIETSCNGEILIITKPFSPFESRSQVREFFAKKLKAIVKKEKEWSNPDIQWNRNCNIKLSYFHGETSVSDVYEVYELLNNMSKYSY